MDPRWKGRARATRRRWGGYWHENGRYEAVAVVGRCRKQAAGPEFTRAKGKALGTIRYTS